MSNVQLAIRIRPFTDKELKSEKDRVQVVSVIDETSVAITNIKVSLSGAGDSRERVRRYFADFTFDSACASSHPNYATQEKVFDRVGSEVLSTIAKGRSACVLTYGQSATGKTHTMMGSPEEPGLIPLICRALARHNPLDITVSYLEIYNERVHDLLATEVLPLNSLPRRKGNARKDLRVRENPSKGTYVQNLRRVPVHDLEALLSVVSEGARRRRTAATKRNSSSSRSHALLELSTASATLHLADLAGSEKSGWEGCGGRQKEGSNINKSLVALSNVISALVSGGSGRGRFVPFRDSALTWLLKECFTGGGKTYIIATVSPSAACYGESASTLRWASQARQLPARPNVTKTAVTKSEIQAQYNQLIAQLENHFIQYKPDLALLQYDDKHWKLQLNKAQNLDVSYPEANIGNIMNVGYSKSDSRNHESTQSSITSGGSDINMERNMEVRNEISKEIDELFGPALERTKSGSDIEVAVPLRHKKRQFRSQEVLQDEKLSQRLKEHRLSDAGVNNEIVTDEKNYDSTKTHVPILYDNQRAEIIASVTERLYSKLRKNEDVSKSEYTPDKKQHETKVQALGELKICSNARQRLMEISKKALRNKRKIGIPAHTQTRKSVIRVKDQGIDVQTDLQTYVIGTQNLTYLFRQDVSTETITMTPRVKDIAIGSQHGTLYCKDGSTATEHRKITLKSSSVMTDNVSTFDRSTQTHIQPPPRRRRRLSAYSKYIKKIESIKPSTDEHYASPVININISPILQEDSESQSSDEISDNPSRVNEENERRSAVTTPDLLSNHNSHIKLECDKVCDKNNTKNICDCDYSNTASNISSGSINFDDSDTEDLILPRVTVDASRKIGQKDYEQLILGYNDDVYPYNIKLSPTRQRDESKRVIRFKDIDVTPAECCSDEWQRKVNTVTNVSDEGSVDNDLDNNYCESIKSNKIETDSFVWNKCGSDTTDTTPCSERKSVKSKSMRAKMYDEFDDFTRATCFCAGASNNDDDYNNSYKNARKSSLKSSKTFDVFERKIKSACNSLENSVNKYDDYLMNFRERSKQKYKDAVQRRTPTEYLQHLIRLRREAVSSDSF
ncbi:kinesin-like protein K39 [Danaus plexippus]|uniref:kinesin-like protein K39 n=1 Tax=Danaus plexippus TaxID=13037 RepID=UPI002AB275E4|nr:kinesin-like protein K39 [Danaus plexippus]